MPTLGDFPKELAHVEILAKVAQSITLKGDTDGIKEDLGVIAHAAREIIDTSEGLVAVARQDYLKALGFIGLMALGCYWSGYRRCMKDMGLNGKNDATNTM